MRNLIGHVRIAVHKLIKRTVSWRFLVISGCLRRLQFLCQGLKIRLGISGHAILFQFVRKTAQQTYVERKASSFREDQDGAPGSHGMAQPEFVENVRVGGRQIRDCVFAEDQALVHWFVDDPAAHLLIGANSFHLSALNRRLDNLVIHAIKVDCVANGIRLFPEGHQHKAEWFGHIWHSRRRVSRRLRAALQPVPFKQTWPVWTGSSGVASIKIQELPPS